MFLWLIIPIAFVSARLWQTSNKATAKQNGISPSTVYNWPTAEKEAIRWLQNHYTTNAIQVAQELLTQALIKATMTKINALDSEHETTKQDAATEIMDRVIGKPRHAVDITTNQPILKTYVNVSPDMWDEEGWIAPKYQRAPYTALIMPLWYPWQLDPWKDKSPRPPPFWRGWWQITPGGRKAPRLSTPLPWRDRTPPPQDPHQPQKLDAPLYPARGHGPRPDYPPP